MYRKSFPDIKWLKERIDTGVAWPTCVLEVDGVRDYREDVKGPISLFMATQGSFYCKTENREQHVSANQAFITGKGERYTLDVDNVHTSTFNIHFGHGLTHEVINYLLTDDFNLLDNSPTQQMEIAPSNLPNPDFLNRFRNEIRSQREYDINQSLEPQFWVSHLLLHLFIYSNGKLLERRMSSRKKSTQVEISNRLKTSIHYILDNHSSHISLDELAVISNMSKFHFLRSFSEFMGTTPHRFIDRVRLYSARKRLQHTSESIHKIAFEVGYESPEALARKFRQKLSMSPSQFRNMVA